jgi:hypothetical protein
VDSKLVAVAGNKPVVVVGNTPAEVASSEAAAKRSLEWWADIAVIGRNCNRQRYTPWLPIPTKSAFFAWKSFSGRETIRAVWGKARR